MNEDLKQLIIEAFPDHEVTFIEDRIVIKKDGVKHNIQYNHDNKKIGHFIPDKVSQIIFDYINK